MTNKLPRIGFRRAPVRKWVLDPVRRKTRALVQNLHLAYLACGERSTAGRFPAMYPLKTILSFLLSGVTRVAPDERAEALCSMLAGLLPQMSEEDIGHARAQVAAQFGATPELEGAVIDLIDGHLALRAIFARSEDDELPPRRGQPDYEL